LRDAGGAEACSACRGGDVDVRNARIRDALTLSWEAPEEPDDIREVESHASAPGDLKMTSKPDPKDSKKQPAPPHPGMMGDGTEEQNLGQRGDPAARIKKDEVDTAFAKTGKKT
jgi:hypothetical protein